MNKIVSKPFKEHLKAQDEETEAEEVEVASVTVEIIREDNLEYSQYDKIKIWNRVGIIKGTES